MNNVIITTLIIEVTRRCNMSCPHCMRGDAQDIDIDLSILDKYLSNFKNGYVREILFTGGEPSLNPEAIRFTLEKVKEYNISVEFYSMITNGKNFSDDIIDVVNSRDNFWVLLSLDIFHDTITDDDYDKLSRIKNLLSKEYNAGETDDPNMSIRKMGRAFKNNLGRVTFPIDRLIFSNFKDNIVLVSNLVCTCYGDILKDCNYSFDDIDWINGIKLCDYDCDIIQIIRDEYEVSRKYVLAEIQDKGNKVYQFIEYLKNSGVEL